MPWSILVVCEPEPRYNTPKRFRHIESRQWVTFLTLFGCLPVPPRFELGPFKPRSMVSARTIDLLGISGIS